MRWSQLSHEYVESNLLLSKWTGRAVITRCCLTTCAHGTDRQASRRHWKREGMFYGYCLSYIWSNKTKLIPVEICVVFILQRWLILFWFVLFHVLSQVIIFRKWQRLILIWFVYLFIYLVAYVKFIIFFSSNYSSTFVISLLELELYFSIRATFLRLFSSLLIDLHIATFDLWERAVVLWCVCA